MPNNTVAASSLMFPVLLLSRASGVSFAESPSDLANFPAALFWKGKFFDGLRIVDSTGRAHQIVSATVQRPKTKLGQWLARLFGATVSVQAETRALGLVSFAELVRAVEADLEKESELFEEFSGQDFTSVKSALAQCASVEDLTKVLSGERWLTTRSSGPWASVAALCVSARPLNANVRRTQIQISRPQPWHTMVSMPSHRPFAS
jgi:hypothetical protein